VAPPAPEKTGTVTADLALPSSASKSPHGPVPATVAGRALDGRAVIRDGTDRHAIVDQAADRSAAARRRRSVVETAGGT
jgi:hypothetical protein